MGLREKRWISQCVRLIYKLYKLTYIYKLYTMIYIPESGDSCALSGTRVNLDNLANRPFLFSQ